ncbi:MAG: hypothetical protein JXB49_22170 [Bacteroidales bacterium]|nr:hypothetical protein [Bacteroidales bacterium]
MKKGFLIFCVFSFIFLSLFVQAQTKREKKIAGYIDSNYEVECLGTGLQGSQLIKIWGYGKSPEDAMIQAKRNAVHAVIFKGIVAGQGCMKRPLLNEPGAEQAHEDYFKLFFSPAGKYLNFVSLSGEGVQERIKIDKKTYKVAINVSVMHSALRQELEAAGIAKKLDAGF